MPQSPADASDGMLRVLVKSNRQPLAEQIRLVAVRIRRALAEIPRATLVVADGDMPTGAWEVADGDTFEPGATITIEAGYGEEAKPLFEGLVVTVGVRITGDNVSRLQVECRGRAVSMTAGVRNAHHADRTDSATIAGLVGRHGLTATVDATPERRGGLTQFRCTDWDFVVSRAAANGLVVMADDDGVRVQAPRDEAEPALCVTWGVDLIDFSAEREARGRMTLPGSALAAPGSLIEVRGVAARFAGNVFVQAIEHTIEDGRWSTAVDFGTAPRKPVERAVTIGTATAVSPMTGGALQIGIVAGFETDPAGEQRIRIRLPALEANASTVWARVAQFHASSGFGALFMPEVDDEVVVGFFDDDPSQPVVLASLYSRRRRPAHSLPAAEHIKSLVTRSGHKLEFDEVGGVATLTTPAGNRVVLDDAGPCVRLQDTRGNQVLLQPDGIRLESRGDLRISAQGAVAIDAVGAVRIGSSSDVEVAGLNVACNGQVGFSAQGGATAELSTAGQAVVKGAMVMIN